MTVNIRNNLFKIKISLYCSDCAYTVERVSVIGDKLQLRLYISTRCVSVFCLAVARWEREIGNSFEFGNGRIIRYSSMVVRIIILEFKIMIYDQISAKETCMMNVSTSWNEMRN